MPRLSQPAAGRPGTSPASQAGEESIQTAIADINQAQTPSDLHAAVTAILGLCGGVRGFAEQFANQFNATRQGSQMRTSMLLASFKMLTQFSIEADAAEVPVENMSDEELRQIVAAGSANT
jgi:hypothetical protein